jgi:hypothetical protein
MGDKYCDLSLLLIFKKEFWATFLTTFSSFLSKLTVVSLKLLHRVLVLLCLFDLSVQKRYTVSPVNTVARQFTLEGVRHVGAFELIGDRLRLVILHLAHVEVSNTIELNPPHIIAADLAYDFAVLLYFTLNVVFGCIFTFTLDEDVVTGQSIFIVLEITPSN